MALPRTQRKLKLVQTDSSSSSEESGSQEELDMKTSQVFAVKMTDPSDFHGIKTLLYQLFLKAHIDTSELTDLIISQPDITRVVKYIDPDMDTEDDPDNLDASFGVLSVVNLTENSTKGCINQIRSYLLSHGKKECDDDKFQKLRRILEDKKKNVGLIVSERMVKIPAYFAIRLYSGLSYDLSWATKGEAFDFEYFILISKIVVFKDDSKQDNVRYTNAEEEIIAEVATLFYDFSVSSEFDSGLAGNWTDDIKGKRKLRVLLFPASQLEHINSKMLSKPTHFWKSESFSGNKKPRLQLVTVETVPPLAEAIASSSIFGGAKPFDTAAKGKGIKRRLALEKYFVKDLKEREPEARVRKFSSGSGLSYRSRHFIDSGPASASEDTPPHYKPPIHKQESSTEEAWNSVPVEDLEKYEKCLAAKLKTYDLKTLCWVQKHIRDILFRADSGEL